MKERSFSALLKDDRSSESSNSRDRELSKKKSSLMLESLNDDSRHEIVLKELKERKSTIEAAISRR